MIEHRVVACLIAPVLLVVGCRAPAEDRPAQNTRTDQHAHGTAPETSENATAPMAAGTGEIRATLLGVERASSNTALVRVRLTNTGDEPFYPTTTLAWPAADGTRPAESSRTQADGITFIDAVANKRYFPLSGPDGTCLCSRTGDTTIAPNHSAEMFAVLPAPPATMRRIHVSVPLTRTFTDVPIADGPARLPVNAADVRPPKILPLISTVEGADQAVDQSDTDESVRLSADVLFAVNKADVTPKAIGALRGVAKRIDRSTDTTVRIDGHTDDTGDDAINDPLSSRRARAVQRVLSRLVTRTGVTYQSAGHGSKEPVAANTSDEGRSRNRRVTVSYTRPAPAGPASKPPPASAQPAAPRPTASEARTLHLDVSALSRTQDGLTVLEWRLTNRGAADFSGTTLFTMPVTGVFYYGGASSGTMGVTLHDETSDLRYYTLRDTQNRCVCAYLIGAYTLEPAEAMTHANAYELPPDVRSVTVEFPGFQPVENVPVT